MFYQPELGHGLPHCPFRAMVSPRPIAWISSVSASGAVNLAPYSFFNAIAGSPPMVMFVSEGHKDTIRNIKETGEFVVNLASRALAEKLNVTSVAWSSEVNEFEAAGIQAEPSRLLRAPRVADAAGALECRVTTILPVPDLTGDVGERTMAIAQVVGIHLRDDCLEDGRFDIRRAGLIARCGYWDYQETTELFEMPRPDHITPH